MTDQELFQRNVDLQTAFMQYTLSRPEILDKLPDDYQLVILPEDEPEIERRNQKLLDQQKFGKPVVIVRMKSPEPAKLKVFPPKVKVLAAV